MPPRVELPFFAYGLLMPGELAHGLIEELVERSVASFAEGALYARDGLPLFDPRQWWHGQRIPVGLYGRRAGTGL